MDYFSKNDTFVGDIKFSIFCLRSIEFFMIRSHLHFKPEFTSRGLENFRKKLPPVGFELTTLTITGSKVECLSE